MKKVTIDPSIAALVDIGPVFNAEDVNIYFTANEPLTGVFEARIYNSFQKNTHYTVANNLTIVDDLMTFRIAPKLQGLEAKDFYYEIWHVSTNRLLFKGNLNIVK